MADDRDLKARDIQELASPDAVAACFARLGYDTSVRLPQTTAAMGITADALARKVGRILVLTDPAYDRLDFVLLERVLPEAAPQGMTVPQIAIRPRVLAVERRKPRLVDLRVLRRFTYEEVALVRETAPPRDPLALAEADEALMKPLLGARV